MNDSERSNAARRNYVILCAGATVVLGALLAGIVIVVPG
jgi:hypothetical protein